MPGQWYKVCVFWLPSAAPMHAYMYGRPQTIENRTTVYDNVMFTAIHVSGNCFVSLVLTQLFNLCKMHVVFMSSRFNGTIILYGTTFMVHISCPVS